MGDSDADEENVIRYGTPLEPYEEDEVPSKRKFQQPADQYAVDAHGRRRFHGAFTGGFSAGYGNTVGTPEGWAPASFKSSRSDKATISSQRPEDFMDDEDRDEFGIAPRQLETHREFSGQKRQRRQFFDGPIPGEPVLEQLVRAVHDTAAVRMLRAMGWREGQGTGERLAKTEKKRAKEQHKVYGCYMPPDMRNENPREDDDSSDSEIDYDTLFAPDDYEPYILQRKNDRFGLGYSGLSRHSVLGNLVGEYGDAETSRSHLTMKEKGKKVSIRGQAFGVGAFEADDDDIYATEDMSHYDFTLGGPAKDKPKKANAKTNNVLSGFVKSSVPLPSVPSYPAPALPRDYTPAPAGSRRSRFEPITQAPRDQGLGRHELTAEARGALLGETPVPKTTVPETKPVQSDPTAKIVGRNVNFVSTTEKKTELDFIPIKDSGKEIQKVFKPFVGDPSKQARYEKYLKNKDAMLDSDSNMDRLCEWERDRELAEFEQAAKLYKPLTGIMEERFTHAAEPDDGINPLCAVAKSTNNYGLEPQELVHSVLSHGTKPLGDRNHWSANDLTFPNLVQQESSVHDKESFTKEQTKFSGSKSLCIDTVTKSKQVITEKMKDIQETSHVSSNTGFNKRMTVAELFLKESEKDLKNNEQNVVTETINKFDKMDLYKSIFLSDSENEEETSKVSNTKDINDFVEKPKNVERNTSPPRGIFANIDFDELNSWRRNTDDKITETKTVNETKPTNKTTDNEKCNDPPETNEDNVYGPKIPENLKKRLEDNTIVNDLKPVYRSKEKRDVDSSSESDSWVEAKDLKSKKDKKKKSKKHKSKHKKSKHKKKDR
ncbi:G patch domain-containing protein 1-like [Papilio xuthus]|uniref:G patch domain-containing protein 1-like n=1 Tax=Papilio xuthus TaxID=66420 RepID=A0A194Q713_PAPXU|nr:G patch domain-containing protein 1-like [Papilio xuthus]